VLISCTLGRRKAEQQHQADVQALDRKLQGCEAACREKKELLETLGMKHKQLLSQHKDSVRDSTELRSSKRFASRSSAAGLTVPLDRTVRAGSDGGGDATSGEEQAQRDGAFAKYRG
jgi:hypothetical protein